MTDSLDRMRRKLDGARQLGTVVHAMKALATLSIGQYESAVRSLDDYVRTVELGLSVCLRTQPLLPEIVGKRTAVAAVVFGSDQGLVGRFNEAIAEYVYRQLATHTSEARLWVVGERLADRFAERRAVIAGVLPVPSSITAIAPLVTQLLVELEKHRAAEPQQVVNVFFNRITGGTLYTPTQERLFPLDAEWERRFTQLSWPTRNLPEALGPIETTLSAHLREYLFVSLFRACAESLSSENTSRLAAMQRAERNIGSLIDELTQAFNGLRQSAIDEELFDVIAGFQALPERRRIRPAPHPTRGSPS